jgi:hypothetical protein
MDDVIPAPDSSGATGPEATRLLLSDSFGSPLQCIDWKKGGGQHEIHLLTGRHHGGVGVGYAVLGWLKHPAANLGKFGKKREMFTWAPLAPFGFSHFFLLLLL